MGEEVKNGGVFLTLYTNHEFNDEWIKKAKSIFNISKTKVDSKNIIEIIR